MGVITERYPATVTSTADPEQRGRIKVKCAGILGDDDAESAVLPLWLEPTLDWGWFYVPDIDEQVEVEIVTERDEDEITGQATLDAPDIRWRGKRFYAPDADPATPVHEDFLENYGKRRGFATPKGHTFIFDDTDGKEEVTLTWRNADGVKSRIQFDKDGVVHVEILDAKHAVDLIDGTFDVKLDDAKHTITMDAEAKEFHVSLDEGKHKIDLTPDSGKITVAEKHTIEITADAMTVNVNEGPTLVVTEKDSNATLTIGDGAKHVAIVEALKEMYNNLKTELDTFKTKFNTHTHSVPSAGLNATAPGAPIAGSATATPTSGSYTGTIPSWDSGIESSKISIPDG